MILCANVPMNRYGQNSIHFIAFYSYRSLKSAFLYLFSQVLFGLKIISIQYNLNIILTNRHKHNLIFKKVYRKEKSENKRRKSLYKINESHIKISFLYMKVFFREIILCLNIFIFVSRP